MWRMYWIDFSALTSLKSAANTFKMLMSLTWKCYSKLTFRLQTAQDNVKTIVWDCSVSQTTPASISDKPCTFLSHRNRRSPVSSRNWPLTQIFRVSLRNLHAQTMGSNYKKVTFTFWSGKVGFFLNILLPCSLWIITMVWLLFKLLLVISGRKLLEEIILRDLILKRKRGI